MYDTVIIFYEKKCVDTYKILKKKPVYTANI